MRKLVYYVGVSLDGHIAGPDEEVDFYPVSDDHVAHMNTAYPEVLPTAVRSHLGLGEAPNRHFDTVVMGRRTYDPALREGITSPYAHLRQYVFSRTMTGSPDPAVTVTAEDPLAVVRRLKAEPAGRPDPADAVEGGGRGEGGGGGGGVEGGGARDIYLAGGGQLAGVLLPEIDRLIVKKYPVVAGAGLPAFATSFTPTRFTLTDSRSFSNGCTVLTLDRA